MFRYIFRKLHSLHLIKQNNAFAAEQENKKNKRNENQKTGLLSLNLDQNLEYIERVLGKNYDFTKRLITLGKQNELRLALVFLSGMTDIQVINNNIIKPLVEHSEGRKSEDPLDIKTIKAKLLTVNELTLSSYFEDVFKGYFNGDSILLMDGSDQALIIQTRHWETRGIEEPDTETIIRGPRAGFIEDFQTNTTLLRRILKSKYFVVETMVLGQESNTTVGIAYLSNIADPLLIQEVKERLQRIKIDAILESGYIEQFIEDAPTSIFSTVANSEKPNDVAGKIIEGRVAILIDGSPMVLTVPMVFIESFQSAEDYYSRPYYASVIRMLRFVAFAISILLPGSYVALLTFHQELIPTNLLFSIAREESGVPFPSFVDMLLMGLIFEILREAGIRLPRPVGQAISIVGALVIGQSAVSAGLVGAPVVILVSLTAVSSFVVPPQTDTGALLRLLFVILGGVMGGIGILFGLLSVFIHISSLRSFGTPYFSPFSPTVFRDLKDTLVRVPLPSMRTRPDSLDSQNFQREKGREKKYGRK
ncbi:MAG: spore germination protein [Desulfitobacteriia bacterium]